MDLFQKFNQKLMPKSLNYGHLENCGNEAEHQKKWKELGLTFAWEWDSKKTVENILLEFLYLLKTNYVQQIFYQ